MHSPESQAARSEMELSTGLPPNEDRPLAETLAAMQAAITGGDAEQAARLIGQAEASHSGDSALVSAIAKCKVVVRRSEWLDTALEAMHRDLEEDRFASALGHFREALGLSRGLAALKSRVDTMAIRHCKDLLPANWRIAETILQEVSHVEPPFPVPPELQQQVNLARADESIKAVLHQADRMVSEGRKTEGRQKLLDLLALHPEDERISAQIKILDQPPGKSSPLSDDAASAVISKLPTFPAEATASHRPDDSELDTQGSLTDPAPAFLAPWRTRIVISNSAWTAIKNFSALAATTAMLGLSGILVWHHFSRPAAKVVAVSPVNPPGLESAASRTPAPPKTPKAGNGFFEDVPAAPSDQDNLLHTVQSYASRSGQKLDGEIVDEIAIQGEQASVRYRPKEPDVGGVITFQLSRQSGVWKVQAVK